MKAEIGGDDRAWLRAKKKPKSIGRNGVVRTVDLFSGCGGLSLGVEEAARAVGRKVDVRLFSELDPRIAAIFSDNFEVAEGGWIANVREAFPHVVGKVPSFAELALARRAGPIDLLVGGPPCQGHSTLNNHTRGSDPKNALYMRMVRAAEVLGPESIIIENVPAVERDRQGVLDRAIGALGKRGYEVSTGIVSIQDIGVPQVRKRHVLLASRAGTPDVELAVESASTPVRDVRWAIDDLRKKHGAGLFDSTGALTSQNARRVDWLHRNDEHDLPNRLRPQCQRGFHKYKSMYGRLYWNQPAQTITTGFGSPGQGRFLHPEERRTLTPHEAARLQFFPDWFDFSSIAFRKVLARAIGNAVPPKLGFVLARHLLAISMKREERGRFEELREPVFSVG